MTLANLVQGIVLDAKLSKLFQLRRGLRFLRAYGLSLNLIQILFQ